MTAPPAEPPQGLPLPIRADFIKTAMLEDRNEVRQIRNRIFQLASLIPVASFAITAFLAGKDSVFEEHKRLLLLVVDFAFLLILGTLFVRLRQDLYHGRQCLEGREEMMRLLGTADEKKPFDPFPDFSNRVPKVKDSELNLVVAVAAAALIGKLVVVLLTVR